MRRKPRMVHRPRALGACSPTLSAAREIGDESWKADPATPSTTIFDPEFAGASELEPGAASIATGTPVARPPTNVVPLGNGLRELQLENVHPIRLRLLLEIERTGSISSAARACSIAQPSASIHIRTLETATGQLLVTRHGRGSRLTPAGNVVASHAERVLATLAGMRRSLDALEGRIGSELILAASLTPTLHLLPAALRAYSERYPGVAVKLRTQPSRTVIEQVVRGSAELGIAAEIPTAEPVISREIATDELIGIAARGTITADGGYVTMDELGRHTLLVGSESSSTRHFTERHLGAAGHRATRIWEFDSYHAIIRAVVDGLGVSFASWQLVRDSLQSGELIAFRVLGAQRMIRTIYVLQSGVRELSPEGAAFVDALSLAGASMARPGGPQGRPSSGSGGPWP